MPDNNQKHTFYFGNITTVLGSLLPNQEGCNEEIGRIKVVKYDDRNITTNILPYGKKREPCVSQIENKGRRLKYGIAGTCCVSRDNYHTNISILENLYTIQTCIYDRIFRYFGHITRWEYGLEKRGSSTRRLEGMKMARDNSLNKLQNSQSGTIKRHNP